MKALVIGEFPAPYRVAVFQELAKEFDLEVYFCANQNEERSKDWFCKSGALSFDVLNNPTSKKKFQKALCNIKQYDFVLAYNAVTVPSIKAIFCCKLCGVPYFVNNDGALPHRSNMVKKRLKRFLYRGAQLCFASGNTSKQYFLANGVKEEKIRIHNFTSLTKEDILPAPMSEAERRALREKRELVQNKVYVMTVGQFIERKGFDLLLQAWNLLKDTANAELLLIGGGGKRTEYEAYIKEHTLKNVTIIDFLKKEDLFDYYKASDLFVFPTREDIWGLVINEAMACGLPVISSDMCVAAQELISHGENGFLYPVLDIDQMAKCLQNLIQDATLRQQIAKNNIDKIQGNTMENIGRQHIKDITEWFATRD